MAKKSKREQVLVVGVRDGSAAQVMLQQVERLSRIGRHLFVVPVGHLRDEDMEKYLKKFSRKLNGKR